MIKKRTLLGKPKALAAFCSIFMLLCLATEATAQSTFRTPTSVPIVSKNGKYDKTAITSITFVPTKVGNDASKQTQTISVSNPQKVTFVDETSKHFYINAGEKFGTNFTLESGSTPGYKHGYVYINTNGDDEFTVKVDNPYISTVRDAGIRQMFREFYQNMQGATNELYAFTCMAGYNSLSTTYDGIGQKPDGKTSPSWTEGEDAGTWGYWDGTKMVFNNNKITYSNGASATSTADFGKNDVVVTGNSNSKCKENWSDKFKNVIKNNIAAPSVAGIYRMRYKLDCNNLDPNPDDASLIYSRKGYNLANPIYQQEWNVNGATYSSKFDSYMAAGGNAVDIMLYVLREYTLNVVLPDNPGSFKPSIQIANSLNDATYTASGKVYVATENLKYDEITTNNMDGCRPNIIVDNTNHTITISYDVDKMPTLANSEESPFWTDHTEQPALVNGYYQIEKPEHLAWFASFVGHFQDINASGVAIKNSIYNASSYHPNANAILLADLDMSAYWFEPIGYLSFYNITPAICNQVAYRGHFNGNNHKIKGLFISRLREFNKATNYTTFTNRVPEYGNALFSCLGGGAVVENLFIESGYIADLWDFSGVIASSVYGTGDIIIRNVGSAVNVAATTAGYASGGFIGQTGANQNEDYTNLHITFENCFNMGSVSGGRNSNGNAAFMGKITGGTTVELKNCYTQLGVVSVNPTQTFFVDATSNVTYENCYINGTTESLPNGVTVVDNELYSNGKLAYLLNTNGLCNVEAEDDNVNYYQKLSGDNISPYPVSITSDPDGKSDQVFRFGVIMEGGTELSKEFAVSTTEYFNKSAGTYSLADFKNNSAEFKNQTLRYSLNTETGDGLYGYGPLKFSRNGHTTDATTLDKTDDVSLTYSEFKTLQRMSTNTYRISNQLEMRWLSWYVNNAESYTASKDVGVSIPNKVSAELSANIDMAKDAELGIVDDVEESFIPVGNTIARPFAGSFDGMKHYVSNLKIADTKSDNLTGLFGVVSPSDAYNTIVRIQNLGIESGTVSGNGYAVGGIVGGIVSGAGAGELVLDHCYNKASINASASNSNAGGLVGMNGWASVATVTISNCYNHGNIVSRLGDAHGAVGFSAPSATGSTITRFYNIGNIEHGASNSSLYRDYPILTNCYTLDGVGDYPFGKEVSSEFKSLDEFKNGNVAYYLNADQQNITFGQKLASNGEIDEYPVLLSLAAETMYNEESPKRVYPLEYYYPENGVYAYENVNVTTKGDYLPKGTYAFFNYYDSERVADNKLVTNLKNVAGDYVYPKNNFFEQDKIFYAGDNAMLELEKETVAANAVIPGGEYFEAVPSYVTMERKDGDILEEFRDVVKESTGVVPGKATANYYEIADELQLRWFSYYVNHVYNYANAILTADITLDSEHSFNPIGDGYTSCTLKSGSASTAKFRGAFNGNGYKIYGLNIASNEQQTTGVGLFGHIATGQDAEELSVLFKVCVESGNVNVATNKGAAGVLGYINGDTNNETKSYIVNCSNKANVTNNGVVNKDIIDGCVAGIVGQINYATNCSIINCYNQGTLSGVVKAGGITPYLESCSASKSTNGETNYTNRQYVQRMDNCYTTYGDVVYWDNAANTAHAFQTVKEGTVDSKGVKVDFNSVELAEITNSYKMVATGGDRVPVVTGKTYYEASKTLFNGGTVAIWLNGGTSDVFTDGKFDESKAALRDVYGQALEYDPIDEYPEFKDDKNGLYAIIFTRPSASAYEAWSFVPATDYIKEYNKTSDAKYPDDIAACNNNLDANISVDEETGLLQIKLNGKVVKYPNIAFVEPNFKNGDKDEVRIYHGGTPVIDRKTNVAFVHPSYTVFTEEEEGYVLSDSLDLHVYAKLVNDKLANGIKAPSAHLANDIVLDNTIQDNVLKNIKNADVKSHLFQPIGTAAYPFTSTFDGRGFKITGLTEMKSTADNHGLFAAIGSGATVKNVGIEGSYTSVKNNAAGLVGEANGATISKCYSNVEVNGKTVAGGLVATAKNTKIEYSYNHGNPTAATIGAIVAKGSGNTIKGCYDISDAPMATNVGDFDGCYALGETGTGVTSATEDQFKKGEITFNLNVFSHDKEGLTEPVYGQNVTIEAFDDYPVFFTGKVADGDFANCVYKAAYSVPKNAVTVPNWPVKAQDGNYFTNVTFDENDMAHFDFSSLIKNEGNIPVVPYFKDYDIYAGHDLKPANTSADTFKAYYNEISASPSLTKTMTAVNGYYEIADSLELRWASYIQNKNSTTKFNFKLMNDIDLSVTTGGVTYNEVQWVPFGATKRAGILFPNTGNNYDDHYSGIIDGNNKTITNLFIDYTKEHDNSYLLGEARAGLVAQMNTGEIKNLVIKGYIRNQWQTGGFVGKGLNAIVISKCGAEVEIEHNTLRGAGGFVGTSDGIVTISDSYTKSAIKGLQKWHYAFIGKNNSVTGTTISNTFNAGTLEGVFEAHNNHLVGNLDNSLIAKFENCYTIETEDDKATINTPKGVNYETNENFKNGKVCYLLNAGGYGQVLTAAAVENLKFRQILGGDCSYDPENVPESVDDYPMLAGFRDEKANVHKAGLFKPEVEPVVKDGVVTYADGADFAYSIDEQLDKGWYFNGTRSLTQIKDAGHYYDCVPTYSVPFFYKDVIYTGDNLSCTIDNVTRDVKFTSSSFEVVTPVSPAKNNEDLGSYEIGDKLHLFWVSYYANKGAYLKVNKTLPENGSKKKFDVTLTADIDMNPGFAFSSKGYHYLLDEKGHAVDSIAPVFKTDDELIAYYNEHKVPYYASDDFYDLWSKYMQYKAYKVVDESSLRGGMIVAQNMDPIGASASQVRHNNDWYYHVSSSSIYKGTFDGGNHKIKNLYVTTYNSVAGLIGCAGNGTVVKNLGVESGYVHSSNSYAGVFCGILTYQDAGTLTIKDSYNKAFCLSEDVNCGAFVSAAHSGGGTINILNCINYADIYTICDPGVLCSNIGNNPHIFNNINLGRLLSRSGLQEIKSTKIANKESINDALGSVNESRRPFYVKLMPNGKNSDFYFRDGTDNTRQSLVARWASGASTPNSSSIQNNVYVEYVGDYNNMKNSFDKGHGIGYNFKANEITDDQRKFQQGDIAYIANETYAGDDTNGYKSEKNKILFVQNMNDLDDKDNPGDLYPVQLNFSKIDYMVYRGKLFDSSADNFNPATYEPEDFYMNYNGANRHPHSGYNTGNAVSTKLGSGNDNWIVFFNHDNEAYNPHSDNTVMNSGHKTNYGVNCVWGKLTKGSNGYAPVSGTEIQADEILLSDPGSKIFTSEYNSTSQKTLYREDIRKQHKDFNFYVPCPVPAKKVSYKRTIKNIKDYATISTPYKVYGVVVNNQDVLGKDIKFYKFATYKTANGRTTVTFKEQKLSRETVEGNEYNVLPVGCYLMKYTPGEDVDAGGSAVLSFRSKTDLYSDLSAVQLKDYEKVSSVEQTDRMAGEVDGSYAQGLFRQKYFDNNLLTVGESTDYVAYQGGYLVRMDNKSFIDPFRMYMYMPKQATSSNAKVRIQFMSLFDDEEVVTDVIDAVMTEDGTLENDVPVDVFDLNGRLLKKQILRSEALDGLDAGVYIINGKKVYKKN